MKDLTPDRASLDAIEIASRDEIAALQLDRLRWSLRHAYDNVPFYKDVVRRGRRASRRSAGLDDLARFPFTVKQDLRDNYPFGMFAVPRERVARIHASSGTTGPADGGGLYRQRPEGLGIGGGAVAARRGPASGRHPAQRLWLRAVHRRPGHSSGRRCAGADDGAGLGRDDPAAGAADRGFPPPGHHRDPVLRAVDPGRIRGAGPRSARQFAGRRHLRRRALDQRDAAGDRGRLRHACGRHLWPVRGDGAGRGQRMRRDQGRAAHLGGSLLSGSDRPRDRADRLPMARSANWSSPR
jgi:hypothetical protein